MRRVFTAALVLGFAIGCDEPTGPAPPTAARPPAVPTVILGPAGVTSDGRPATAPAATKHESDAALLELYRERAHDAGLDAHPRLAPLADPSQARRSDELLAGGVPVETDLPDEASCRLFATSTRAAMLSRFAKQTIAFRGESHDLRVFDPRPERWATDPSLHAPRRIRVEPTPDGMFAIREGCRPPFDVVPMERVGAAIQECCLGGAATIAVEAVCLDALGPGSVLDVLDAVQRVAPDAIAAIETAPCPVREARVGVVLPKEVAIELVSQEGPLDAVEADRALAGEGAAVAACIEDARLARLSGGGDFVVDAVIGVRGGVSSLRVGSASPPFGDELGGPGDRRWRDLFECVGLALGEAHVPGAGAFAEASYLVRISLGDPAADEDR